MHFFLFLPTFPRIQKNIEMKMVRALILLIGFTFFTLNMVNAQDAATEAPAATEVNADSNAAPEETAAPAEEQAAPAEPAEKSGHQVLKEKFIEGGAGFMALPLICLILGLAIAVERIISLNLASVNTDKFVSKIEEALKSGGVEAAKDICRNTRGPVASIFYQGLDRANEGKIDIVEKSVISYGSVQMGQLEKGLVWISLFIALAPMLGFLGTVIGMIEAFDEIERVGDISPAVVARGIKIALLTTVAGLIVAIILQLFYNYLMSKIDSIVNGMEDASISLVDMLIKYNIVKG